MEKDNEKQIVITPKAIGGNGGNGFEPAMLNIELSDIEFEELVKELL